MSQPRNSPPPRVCTACNGELPENAPRGLCPACLLQRGLEENTADFVTDRERNAALAPWEPLSVESLVPHFPELEILAFVGRGGMGAVYRARQRNLDRIVALKILPPEIGVAPEFSARFTREAQAMARLNHPHIVTIHEFGQRDNLFYFVMEFVDGLSLRGLLDSGHVSPREALVIVPQICEALQYAHDQNVVHRDIKPENILLNKLGSVKIADFGLAKLVLTSDSSISESVMGTPLYMAPEQLQCPMEVDHRADIYAVGVVFYQLLTGELPKGTIEPPSRRVLLDVRLDAIVLRALEKEPERRYQQIGEIKTQVETITFPEMMPDESANLPGYRTLMSRLFAPSNRWTKRLVALLLMVCVVGIAASGLLIQAGVLNRPPTIEELARQPYSLKKLSVSEVTRIALAQPDMPWAWQELQQRPLTPKDAQGILDGLTTWLENAYPRGYPTHLSWVEPLLRDMAEHKLIGEASAIRLLKAYEGMPRYEPKLRMRDGHSTLSQSFRWGSTFKLTPLGMTLLNELQTITLDDQQIEFKSSSSNSIDWCMFDVKLPELQPGKHWLKLEILTVIVRTDDTIGLAPNAPSTNWPSAKLTCSRIAEIELTVYAQDAVIVQQVTDRQIDPTKADGLLIDQILVRPKGHQTEAVVVLNVNPNLPIPISFDVDLIIANERIRCGHLMAHQCPDGRLSGFGNRPFSTTLSTSLPLEITQADLLLTPNPQWIEPAATVELIWGAPIEFKGVPLNRQDATPLP